MHITYQPPSLLPSDFPSLKPDPDSMQDEAMSPVMFKSAFLRKRGHITFPMVLKSHTLSSRHTERVLEGTDSIEPLMRRCVHKGNCERDLEQNIHVVGPSGMHTHNPPKVKLEDEVTLVECSRLIKIELRNWEDQREWVTETWKRKMTQGMKE